MAYPFSLLCQFVRAGCLASILGYTFVYVGSNVLCHWDSHDGLQVFISETTPVWCFVNLHHRKQLLTQICAIPNMLKVRAACRRSWGISSEMKWVNCASPPMSYFAVVGKGDVISGHYTTFISYAPIQNEQLNVARLL